MKNGTTLSQKIAIIVMAIVSLVPIIVIAFFNHPSVDDFNYSADVYKTVQAGGGFYDALKTAIDTSRNFMNSWQGLYSSAFLLALQPGVWGDGYYWITTPLMITLIIFGTMFFVRSIFVYIFQDKRKDWIWVSIIVSFFFIQTMPYPVEGLYWYNGAMNYVFFWSMLMFLASQYIIISVNEKAIIRTIIVIPAAFLLSGGNHIMAFAGILVSLVFGLYQTFRQKKYLSLLPFVVGVLGFVINLSSNGTKLRKAALFHDGNFIETMLAATVRQVMILNEWINFALILLLVLLTPFLYRLLKECQERILFKWKTFLGLLLGFAVLMLAMWCVPYQAMGNFGSGRLRNVLFMSFIILCIVLYGYFLGILMQNISIFEQRDNEWKNKSSVKHSGFIYTVITVVTMGMLILFGGTNTDYGTGMEAVMEMNQAKQYDEEIEIRLSILEDDSIKEAVLSPLKVKPALLYFDDIVSDKTNWKNVSMASYYNKVSVSTWTE